jgi:arabinose-5-phosphate isomerase
MTLDLAKKVLKTEAEAILNVMNRLDGGFLKAVDLMAACKGKVVITGMGKSGIICRKIAATLSSTGTPAVFMHPAEAIHGDLGIVAEGDIVIAVSNSGETEEILQLLEVLHRMGVPIIGMSSNPESTLARYSTFHLDVGVSKEACPLNLAPTASTTATLALGDALSMALLVKKGFKEEDFALRHPGGALGKKLMKVGELMHTGDALPKVTLGTSMKDAIYEMSSKTFGITAVVDGDGVLKGVISDGDLRRLFQRDEHLLKRTAGECMKADPKTITSDALASDALRIFEERKITSLFITDASGKLQGLIHLHDLWRVKLF